MEQAFAAKEFSDFDFSTNHFAPKIRFHSQVKFFYTQLPSRKSRSASQRSDNGTKCGDFCLCIGQQLKTCELQTSEKSGNPALVIRNAPTSYLGSNFDASFLSPNEKLELWVENSNFEDLLSLVKTLTWVGSPITKFRFTNIEINTTTQLLQSLKVMEDSLETMELEDIFYTNYTLQGNAEDRILDLTRVDFAVLKMIVLKNLSVDLKLSEIYTSLTSAQIVNSIIMNERLLLHFDFFLGFGGLIWANVDMVTENIFYPEVIGTNSSNDQFAIIVNSVAKSKEAAVIRKQTSYRVGFSKSISIPKNTVQIEFGSFSNSTHVLSDHLGYSEGEIFDVDLVELNNLTIQSQSWEN